MDWNQLRRKDGTIDLHRAYECLPGTKLHPSLKAWVYIDSVESLQPICSRQAAAIVLANALAIAREESPNA